MNSLSPLLLSIFPASDGATASGPRARTTGTAFAALLAPAAVPVGNGRHEPAGDGSALPLTGPTVAGSPIAAAILPTARVAATATAAATATGLATGTDASDLVGLRRDVSDRRDDLHGETLALLAAVPPAAPLNGSAITSVAGSLPATALDAPVVAAVVPDVAGPASAPIDGVPAAPSRPVAPMVAAATASASSVARPPVTLHVTSTMPSGTAGRQQDARRPEAGTASARAGADGVGAPVLADVPDVPDPADGSDAPDAADASGAATSVIPPMPMPMPMPTPPSASAQVDRDAVAPTRARGPDDGASASSLAAGGASSGGPITGLPVTPDPGAPKTPTLVSPASDAHPTVGAPTIPVEGATAGILPSHQATVEKQSGPAIEAVASSPIGPSIVASPAPALFPPPTVALPARSPASAVVPSPALANTAPAPAGSTLAATTTRIDTATFTVPTGPGPIALRAADRADSTPPAPAGAGAEPTTPVARLSDAEPASLLDTSVPSAPSYLRRDVTGAASQGLPVAPPSGAEPTPPLDTSVPATPAYLQPYATGAAGQVFAAALHAADPERTIPKADAGATSSGDPTGRSDPVIAGILAATPPASGDVAPRGAAVDLHHVGWPAKMAEQIEVLRDAADAVSTRVRVSPDALGPVDLQVRREGDQVHVHFTAHNADTRTLLGEAQPQLAQAAAERGIRLGQTSVGSGSGGFGDGTGPRGDGSPARQPARHPADAPAPVTADPTDTRIA